MENIRKTNIASVDALYNIDFSGNIIPCSWFDVILTGSGKPDMNAIVILSEILYWHKPRESCGDGDNGEIVLEKRFDADMLQLSYGQLKKKFNLTKSQCRRAMDNLERLGLIQRHYDTVETKSGNRIGNVMFVELYSDRLLQLTLPDQIPPCKKKATRVSEKSYEVIDSECTGNVKNAMTNTKNTTEISNRDYNHSIYAAELHRVRDQVEYDFLIADRKNDQGVIDNIIDLIVEINLSSREYHMIGGEPMPAELVKKRFAALSMDMIRSVIDKIKASVTPISNMKPYLLTLLFNTPATYETELAMQVSRDMYVNSVKAYGS